MKQITTTKIVLTASLFVFFSGVAIGFFPDLVDAVSIPSGISIPSTYLAPEVQSPSGSAMVGAENQATNVSAVGAYQVPFVVNTDLWYAWNRWQRTGTIADIPGNQPQPDTQTEGWEDGLSNPTGTVSYDLTVLNSSNGVVPPGSNVSVGTPLTFKFMPLVDQDIAWFGTGFSMDSPYGHWSAAAAAPARSGNYVTCDPNDFVTDYAVDLPPTDVVQLIFGVYIPFEVAPPTRTLAPGSGLSCGAAQPQGDGSILYSCTVTGPGSLTPTFNFSSTYGYFYYRYSDSRNTSGLVPGCYGNNIPMTGVFGPAGGGDPSNGTGSLETPYQVPIAAKSVTYSLTGTGSVSPPANPSIGGPTSGVTGTSYNYTFTSTDPNNTTLRYGVDWNDDGVVDQYIPAAGYVPSGTTQSQTESWASPGTYTFEAFAQNSTGQTSGWTKYTVTITPANRPPVGNVDFGSCYTTSGWAFDPDTTSSSVNVQFYIDGVYAGQTLASNSRPDVQVAYGLPMANYGFSWNVPNSYSDNGTHTMTAYAIDSGGGANTQLQTSTFSCPPPPTNPTYMCNAPGTQVTLSWNAAPGATQYYPRIYNLTPAACTAANTGNAWQIYTDNVTCYPNPDGITGTSVVNFPVNPGQSYGWFVQSGKSGQVNWNLSTGGGFTCNSTLPDVVSLNAPPQTTATEGIPVTFTGGVIKNQGAGTASNFHDILQIVNLAGTIGLDVVAPTPDPIASLAVNATQAVSGTYTFTNAIEPPGQYLVRFCANFNTSYVQGMAESNLNNNCGPYQTVTVSAALPDLVSLNAPVQNTATEGVPMTFTGGLIKNQGVGTASNINDILQIVDITGTTALGVVAPTPDPVASLAVNATQAISGTYTFTNAIEPPGQYLVRFCTNYTTSYVQSVPESNYGNDCGGYQTVTVSAAPLADLEMFAADPNYTVTAGSSHSFSNLLLNASVASSTATGFWVNFEVCDPASAAAKGTAIGDCSIGAGVEFLNSLTASPGTGVFYGAAVGPGKSGFLSYSWTAPTLKTWTIEHDLNRDLAIGGPKGYVKYAIDLFKDIFLPSQAEASGTYTVDYRWCVNNNDAWVNTVTESNYANDCGTWGTVTVNTAAPTASCSLTSATPMTPGGTATWAASATGGNPPYTYLWGSSVVGTTQTVNQVYSTPGTYTGTIVVTDKLGATTTPIACSNSLTVVAPPSVSCNVSTTSVAPDVPVTYTAVPANGATSPYTWTPSDGVTGLGSASTATRIFPGGGTYAMNLNATGVASPAMCPNVFVTGPPTTCTDTPAGTLTASPSRVPTGNSGVTLSFSALGIPQGSTCTITGPGVNYTTAAADFLCNVNAGTTPTPAITAQSTYTMTCSGWSGNTKATVNVVPGYNEF